MYPSPLSIVPKNDLYELKAKAVLIPARIVKVKIDIKRGFLRKPQSKKSVESFSLKRYMANKIQATAIKNLITTVLAIIRETKVLEVITIGTNANPKRDEIISLL